MVWLIFSWHFLGFLMPSELCLNARVYLVLANLSSDRCFHQDNISCHTAHIIPNMFIEQDDEFPVLKCLHNHQIPIQQKTFGMWWDSSISWMLSQQIKKQRQCGSKFLQHLVESKDGFQRNRWSNLVLESCTY